MSKRNGLGQFLAVDQYLISNDVRDWSAACPVGQLDATGIDKTARERLNAHRHGTLSLSSFFNDATGQAFDALADRPTADRIVTIGFGERGGPAMSMIGKQIGYDPTRSNDGGLTMSTAGVGNGYGAEWGHVLTGTASTPVTTSTGAQNLTGVDDGAGAATDFGLQAYLHVLAFTGTSATITIQDSDDDGSGDAYAAVTGAQFAAVTGVGQQRIQTGRTENVKEWLRVATTGTYSNLEFIVVVVPNRYAAVAF